MIELIIVMAIIAILAGIMSLAIGGFQRDARIETNNNKAQMIYMAFQDILIDCEVKQDKSIFEGHSGEDIDGIVGAVVFFRISEKDANNHANKNGTSGLGDEIHVMAMHAGAVTNGGIGGSPNLCSRSFWISGTDNPDADSGPGANDSTVGSEFGLKGAKRWDKFNTYISKRMDKSMAGTYVVALDLANYQVLSVIYRELENGKDPKTGLYDPSEVGAGNPSLSSYINFYEKGKAVTTLDGVSVEFPVRTFLVKDVAQEKDIVKKSGVYIGAYPLGDSLYKDVTAK